MTENEKQPQRRLTVTWDDPKVSARNAAEIGGLEYLQGIADGTIPPPPIALLLGYRIAAVEKGRAEFTLTPAEYLYNPFATLHGGIAATLLDTAMTAAVLSCLPKGAGGTTLEIKVNYLRPVSDRTGPVRAIAEAVHLGRQTATAQGRLIDGRDKWYAHAIATFMILKG